MLALSLVALVLALSTLVASVWAMDERERRRRLHQQIRRLARQQTSGVPPLHAPVREPVEAGTSSAVGA